MKIDRRNPLHWIYLTAFAVNVAIAIFIRLFSESNQRIFVLYGHKFSGNLKAIYEENAQRRENALRIAFLSLDPGYCQELKSAGVNVVCAAKFEAVPLLVHAVAIVTDHGLHAMIPLLRLSDVQFFDVWHGIPFKGFDAEDFRVQRRYTETWVASPLLADLYVRKYGFNPDRVVVTGYARTDRLSKNSEDESVIRAALGVPDAGPLVLFAPTWRQDERGRSLYPFGCLGERFLGEISAVAARHGGTVLMRAHLNSGAVGADLGNVISVPQELYPDTEAILLVSNVLICDWSSIAFDYLLLERPTLFLEVPAPFAKGFSMGPEYRFGPVVKDLGELTEMLDAVLENPDEYRSRWMARVRQIQEKVYGGYADGNAAGRCLERLRCERVKV